MGLLSSFFTIFFPERCAGCKRARSALCTKCIRRIPLATPLPHLTYAVFDYGNTLVRKTIRELKYHRRSESARALADAAGAHIAEYVADKLQSSTPDTVVLIPIPEHRRKQTARGFNQSLLLAQWWARRIEGSKVQKLLTKTVFTLPQAHLNRSARLKNVTHTMECTMTLNPRRVYIVVDDVTTTGATFAEARRALTAAGAKKIFCVALAHGYAKK